MAKSIILTVTVLTILLLNLTYCYGGKDTRNRTDTSNDDYVNQTKIIQYNVTIEDYFKFRLAKNN